MAPRRRSSKKKSSRASKTSHRRGFRAAKLPKTDKVPASSLVLSDVDLNDKIMSNLKNCKDVQSMLRMKNATDDEYAKHLLGVYGSYRNVFNQLCHLSLYCPNDLPELDYAYDPPRAPNVTVTFGFHHPINADGNALEGVTFTAASDEDAYENTSVASNYHWYAETRTWNRYQRGLKTKTKEQIEELHKNWAEKINQGTFR